MRAVLRSLAAATLLAAAFAGLAFAQGEAAPTAVPDVLPTVDATHALVMLITSCTTAVMIYLFKVFVPKYLPKNILPLIAPVIGVVAESLIQAATGVGFGPILAAFLGSAGVGIREGIDQLSKRWTTVETAKTST